MRHSTVVALGALTFLLLTISPAPVDSAPRRTAPPRGVLGTYVRGPERLSAGAPAALRVATHASTSESASVPFADVEVTVTLSGQGRRQLLFHGRSDGGGVAEARFVTPDWPDGSYQLAVDCRAGERRDSQTHSIAVAAGARLLLESDKPLYQPAQIIHLKAVAQRPIDGRPLGARQATFLVFDPRGNEVFRRAAPLSEFGVAAADFQLADEILTGGYRARVEAEGAASSERLVSVERYSLPKFKLTIESDRAWYAPGERAHLTVEGRYFFGKPVSGGKLTVSAGPQVLHAKLDADGKARLELEVPRNSVDESSLRFSAEVVDAAEHKESAARMVTVARDPLRLELTTASARAVPGADNLAWLVAARPDGTPLADAQVELRVDGAAAGSARTDAIGVATLDYRVSRTRGSCVPIEAGLHQTGTVVWSKRCLPLAQSGALTLATDRALYPSGEPIEVKLDGLGADGPAFVDIEKDGQLVDTVELAMRAGHGSVKLGPDERRFGTLALVAYRIRPDGEKSRDSRLIYVERPSSLKLELSADNREHAGGTLRPGGGGRLHVRVLDGKSGAGVRASVGLVMVDQSLLAMRALEPHSARLFFTLAEEASRPSLAMKAKPGGYTLERLVEEGQLDALKQEAAQILLAGALPLSSSWESDPWSERREAREARLQKLADSAQKWAELNTAGEPTGSKSGWRWRRDLAAQVAAGARLTGRDPWGRRYSTDEIIERAGLGDFASWAAEETNRRLQAIYFAVARAHLERSLPADPQSKKAVVLTLDDLQKLAADGKMDKRLLMDPWGRPWRIFERKRVVQVALLRSRYLFASSGPDGVAGSSDDLYAVDYGYDRRRVVTLGDLFEVRGAVAGEAFGRGGLGLMGHGSGGGGGVGYGYGGRGAMGALGRSVAAGMESAGVRVRRDFPETMLWQPALLTDARGEASLDVTMADSITTWQLAAEAIAADGRIATGTLDVRVFQDFFVDLDLPPAVTQHDELAVPVAVYNYLPTAQRVTLTLDDAHWFTRTGEQTQSIDLAPSQVGVRYFRVRVSGIGRQKFLVRAQGSGASDAVEKPIEITPDGSERSVAFAGRLEGSARHTLSIPANAIADASLAQLKIYPSMTTHVIEGLDSMLRMPGGCFEQTSSSNYPNALILDYLRRSKKSTPEVEKKALAYLEQGYQRLLSFEVRGGGFSWFGQAPANKILTAYGVEEFFDMARVTHVDKQVIARTQRWLAEQQKPDGSWAPDTQFINEGATNHFNSDVVRITAYIAVALKHSGWRGPEVARASDWVRLHLKSERPSDSYTLALVSELLSTGSSSAGGGELDAVLERLWSERRDQDKTSWFTPSEKTPTHGDGKSATVETTALAAYAMLQAPGASLSRVERAVGYLLGAKDTFGNWYSTQATILSLKALLAYGEKAGQKARGTAVVLVDGREAGRVRVAPEVEALQVVDLPAAALAGEHAIEVRFDGQGPIAYQIVGRYWEPSRAAAPGKDFEVATRLDHSNLKPGGVLVEEVRVSPGAGGLDMPIVTAGLPPGFDVDGEELEALVRNHVVEKVQHGARELTFYLNRIDKPLTLKLHLTSRFPETVQVPAATAYEYYQPERRAAGQAVVVTVDG